MNLFQKTEPAFPILREAFDWYDEYAHDIIDRRTVMGWLATLTAAGFTMGSLFKKYLALQDFIPATGNPKITHIHTRSLCRTSPD